MENISISGARQHNLKNISLVVPKNKFIVFTGVSGSGKSSLAFDTIYAEGQRRYVESLSSYARQFLGIMDKPDVDSIEGLSPAISIDQKSTSHNPRSTVGTVTEIYDYLRLLYARIGHPHCPNCGREISRQTITQIEANIITLFRENLENENKKIVRLAIMSPVIRDRKGEYTGLFENLRAKGYRYIRVDGKAYSFDDDIVLIKTNKHTIEVITDRISLDQKSVKLLTKTNPTEDEKSIIQSIRMRIHDAVEQAINLSQGLVIVSIINDSGFDFPEKPKNFTDHIYSEKFSCPVCNISIAEIEPRSFSFNSPHGACPTCSGIGSILTVDPNLVLAPSISLSEGGIIPFARMFYHDTWYARVIGAVCQEHDIDPKIPLNKLSPKQKDVLLYGTGDRKYLVHGTNRFGDQTTIEEAFIGVIGELKRRFSQSDSEFVRAEIEKYMRKETCQSCGGKRLKKESLTVTIDQQSIAKICDDNIIRLLEWIDKINHKTDTPISDTETQIASPILKEIHLRLTFLKDVGLEYLTLSRAAMSLSGGEAQRIRLASQIGSGLSGVLYVLDEPSIGLHPRDNQKLIDTLFHLRDLGNTVIVVEHDREMMEQADYLVDFGPGAGVHGGKIVAQGSLNEVLNNPNSITAKYLNGKRKIVIPQSQLRLDLKPLKITGVRCNNLKNIDVEFPKGILNCVTGASGSGKSSLIVETLYQALFNHFNPYSRQKPGDYDNLQNIDDIEKVILIDQSPIGRTPRSNPATYTGIFTFIRELYSSLPAAKMRGYTPGRFSFNIKGGRCEACEGEGQKRIEMQFLSDVYITCEVCHGTRFNPETLEVLYRDKNIADVLNMTVDEAEKFFEHIPFVAEKLHVINEVGLGYIHVGQPATTLSGGEAQRVKLASELMRRSNGKTVYILDEPTTGLHFADLEKLLGILHRLTQLGNTVIVIEHNLDVIKNADWIIDLGPDGGEHGGEVIAVGSPRDVARNQYSYTGQFLKKVL